MLSIFSCVSWSSVCLLWRNIYLLLLPIFDWVVCLSDIEMYELFVYFGNNPMLVTSFTNIFSHSVCCLFILFMISLLCKKKEKKKRAFKFNWIPFVYFCFYFLYSRRSKNYCCDLCQCSASVFL